jgi:hypothetical protein
MPRTVMTAGATVPSGIGLPDPPPVATSAVLKSNEDMMVILI